MVNRDTVSVSVQLMTRPVISSLFGTISSRRSLSVMVVARIRIRLTFPVISPIETMSPMRTGRSNSRISPETKLAKISCSPKPSPTVMAATSQFNCAQPMPTWLKAASDPATSTAYRAMAATAYRPPWSSCVRESTSTSSSSGSVRWQNHVSTLSNAANATPATVTTFATLSASVASSQWNGRGQTSIDWKTARAGRIGERIQQDPTTNTPTSPMWTRCRHCETASSSSGSPVREGVRPRPCGAQIAFPPSTAPHSFVAGAVATTRGARHTANRRSTNDSTTPSPATPSSHAHSNTAVS